jgi:ABC-2 type transport system ATP-binding protein
LKVFDGSVLRAKYIAIIKTLFKVGITGCLLQKPEMLILDEPFANLDPTTQMRLLKMLREIHAKPYHHFISSHDLNHVTDISTRILLMEKGRLSETSLPGRYFKNWKNV